MKLIRTLAQRDPTATGTILTFVAGAASALFGHPEFTGVLVAAGLLILGIRSQVTPAKKAAEATNQAATTAALEVAKNLTTETAGAVGEVTGAAAGVVDEALQLVAGLTGVKR